MPKAKRKHTPKPPQRTPRIADPCIALGLRYVAAQAAYGIALNERDAIQEKLFPLYPQKPPQLQASGILTRDEIRALPEHRRAQLLPLFDEYDRAREKIDVEAGLAAKQREARTVERRADAFLTLWLQEPPTSVCGIAMKLTAGDAVAARGAPSGYRPE